MLQSPDLNPTECCGRTLKELCINECLHTSMYWSNIENKHRSGQVPVLAHSWEGWLLLLHVFSFSRLLSPSSLNNYVSQVESSKSNKKRSVGQNSSTTITETDKGWRGQSFERSSEYSWYSSASKWATWGIWQGCFLGEEFWVCPTGTGV